MSISVQSPIADEGMVELPDEVMVDVDFEVAKHDATAWKRLRCRHDFVYWARECCVIKHKLSGREVPFELNAPQMKLLKVFEKERLAGRPIRVILLKSRQWGGRALCILLIYLKYFVYLCTMEKKVIILARTSTTRQEIESQKKELFMALQKDGYTEADAIEIGGVGHSARKLNEAYLKDMDEVKNALKNIPTIEAMYVWAVDRMVRTETIFYEIKDILKEKKIQLVILNPSMRLFNNRDGKMEMDSGVELALSVLVTMAKQEMEQKEARFKRARKRNDEQGKYNGGFVAFGYMVKDGYIVINEEEAAVVRLIFEELATGKYSCDGLARELQSRGIKFKGKKMLFSNVRGILKNNIYCGEQVAASGTVRNLPQIVSKELFEKARAAISANNPSKTNTTTNRTQFGVRLIKCPYCGCHFSVASKLYQCHNHNRNYYDSRQGFEKCPNGISIGAANLDRLLWYAAATAHYHYIKGLTENRDVEIAQKIAVLIQKIQHLEGEIEGLSEKRSRINLVFMDGDISKEDRDARLAKLIKDNEAFAIQIRDYQSEIKKLVELREGKVDNEIMFESYNNLMLLEDKELQSKIVRKHIKNISLEKSEYAPYKRVLIITIEFYDYPTQQYLYLAKSLGEFFTMTNGEPDRDLNGNLKPIVNLDKLKKAIGKKVLSNYRFSPEVIAVKDSKDKDKIEALKAKYEISRRDMFFILHTANRFHIGVNDDALQRMVARLISKGLVISMDEGAIPL